MAADFTSLTKSLYDLHKAEEPGLYKGSPLAALVVENFDEEQIWQQLELQNNAVLKHFNSAVEGALLDETLTLLVGHEEETSNEEEEEDEMDNENLEEEEEEEGEVDAIKPKLSKKMASGFENESEDYTDQDSDLDFDVDALEKRENQKKCVGRKESKTKIVPSEVDDKFFKLSEMESFLDDMDKREGKEDGDEEDVNYFQDLPSDDDNQNFDQIFAAKKQKKTTVCISFFKQVYHVLLLKNVEFIIVFVSRPRAPGISSTKTTLTLWIVNQQKPMLSQMLRMTTWVTTWLKNRKLMKRMRKRRILMCMCA